MLKKKFSLKFKLVCVFDIVDVMYVEFISKMKKVLLI